jgi:polyisoprenoid-binding protein YceI
MKPTLFAVPALALALLSLSLPAAAQQKLNPAQSEINFVFKQMGVPVEGHFKKFDGDVQFDPAKPAASRVAFTVNIGSATLGNAETDAELPKSDWFNTAKFPQASFASSAFKALGGGKYEVAGKLTIKGQSQDVTVPVQMAQNGAVTTATGTFPIKRLTFKIGENEWTDTSMVANDVQVKFKFSLTGVPKL